MTYPLHNEKPIINTAPRKLKKEADIEIYVDIEGTLIDDLFNANFLNHNCDNIRDYIHKHDGHNYKVHIFTWGWVHRSEIELGLVDNLYKRLEVAREHRGSIYVKEDAVKTLIDFYPEMPYDRNILMNPGGFNHYGFSKPAIWGLMITSENKFNVLIDDTVDCELDTEKVKYINPARMKVVIRNYLDRPALLYNPDGCIVGEIKNVSAYDDVRRQIGLQRLNGYYIMFEGQRININSYGDASDNPNGFFDAVLDACADLLDADNRRDAFLKDNEAIYPQPINPEVTDDEDDA